MAASNRKCRHCKAIRPLAEMQIVSGGAYCVEGNHAKEYANRQKAKTQAARKKKPKALPSSLRKKCLDAMQLLRRLEEADDSGYCKCVTCGASHHYKEMDGGHFIPKGHSSFWALEPENIHPQCKGCNRFAMQHGTAAYEYGKYMERRYGEVFVQNMLETKRDIRKISRVEYEDLLSDINLKIKQQMHRIGES